MQLVDLENHFVKFVCDVVFCGPLILIAPRVYVTIACLPLAARVWVYGGGGRENRRSSRRLGLENSMTKGVCSDMFGVALVLCRL